jgi:predicted dehydrogenase
VHDIDWLNANFGPIRKVFCQGTQRVRPKTDYAMATFTLSKGVIAQVIHSYQSTVIASLRAEICGTAGMVQYDSADVAIRQTPARSVKEQRAQDTATTWAGHWRAFAELVDRGGFSAKEAAGYGAPAKLAGWAVQSVQTSSPVVCTK